MPSNPTWEDTLDAPTWDATTPPPIDSPEQMQAALRAQGPSGMTPPYLQTTTQGVEDIARDPSQLLAAAMGAFNVPGRVAYGAAADVVSKIAGQPEYGGNVLYGGDNGPTQPVDRFLSEVAVTNPKLATVGRIGESLAAMSPMTAVGMLPANLAKLATAGFTVDMIRHAPEQFAAYADEINKPIEEQNPDTLARLRSDIIQTFTFAPLAGAHAIKGVPQEIGYALDLVRENVPGRAGRAAPASSRAAMPAEEGAPVPTWDATEMVKQPEAKPEPKPWEMEYAGGEMPAGSAWPVAESPAKAKPQMAQMDANPTEAKPAKPVEAPGQAVAKVQEHVAAVAAGEKPMAKGSKADPVKPAATTAAEPIAPKRAAKEIKSELVQRLEEALASAKAENDLSQSAREALDLAKSTNNYDSQYAPQSDYSKAERLKREAERRDAITKERSRRVEEAKKQGLSQITIEIPGDGTFTVWNTKESIGEVLRRAKKLDVGAQAKGFKESKPGAQIPADVWVNSSEPTHLVTVLAGDSTASRLGKKIEFKAFPGKELYLTSDGEGFTITEPRTGAKIGGGDTISSAIKSTEETLAKIKAAGIESFEAAVQKNIAEKGLRPPPKPILPQENQTVLQSPPTAGGINTGNLGEVGMGGAKPGEFRNNPTTPTGIRNAVVDQERVKRGLPPAMEAARKDFGTTWDEAMARIDQDPAAPERLVTELNRQARPLTDVENALLLHRQIELQNEYGKLTRDLAMAYEDSASFPNRLADVEELKVRVAETSDKLQAVYDAGKAAGTEQGRGLASRKMMAFEDYSLAKMELEKRAAKGGAPLSDAERAELTKLQQRIETTERQFQEYQAKVEAERANRMTDEAIRDMQEELKRRPTYDSRIIKIAEEIVGKLEKQAVSAQERLKQKFTRTNTGLDPTILYDLGVVGAAKIARLGLDFSKFSADLIATYGDGVRDYLEAAWEKANLHLENEGAKYGDKAPQVRQLLRKRDVLSKRENIVAGLQKGKAEGIPVQLEGDYIRKLAEGFVEQGITQREPLIDAVHGVLTKEVGLEITRRETMDAISGYGKYKPLNTNAVKATLRDLRGQMQQVAKLEDIQARKPLQKTGVERRTPSDAERRLLQQVNEAKRRFGVVVNDPARQLKGALDAINTRLKNQISDLEYQINTKERTVKTKTPSPHDAETKLLEVRRDELRAQLDELVPKPGLTMEQQVARVMRGLERSIEEYQRRIENKDVNARQSKPLSAPELEAMRAKRDAVRAEWEELRASSEAWQWQQQKAALERQKASLEETIKAKEQQIASGDFARAPKEMNRPADPALEALIQKREALNRVIAEARKKPEAQKYAEAQARKLEQIKKQIAEREAKLASGDLSRTSAPAAMNRPMSPELEQAKQQLELVTKQLEEARRGPKLTPEERNLKILKARIAQSTANYLDRLARKDFAPRQRPEPKLDAEAQRLKAENELAKREFQRGLIKDRMENRSTGRKVYDTAKEMLNLPRNMLSSWDVSAVLRQGGFISIGNPARGAAALPAMFKALASEKAAVMVEQEILSRPNAPLYKQSKLYLAPHEALHLSAMEEQIMSRLGNKIPGLAASNRAYITYLNRLRADSFDALVASVARKDGNLTPVELNAIANYINVATGRGEMGKFSNMAEGLATVFFSPRLVTSRFQLLAGQPFYRGSLRTRLAIAQEYGKFLAGIGVVYALGSLAGATIETDRRSSDFGKLRFGNTRVDILGGLGQVTVLLSRLKSGETMTSKGEVKPIVGEVPYGGKTAWGVITDFLRSKLAPVVGTAIDARQGKNVVGEPVSPKDVAVNLTVPLSFRDIYDVMKEQGMAAGTALGILSLFGFGLQQYESKTTTPEVNEIMKHVRGVPKEQRDELRKRLEEAMKP